MIDFAQLVGMVALLAQEITTSTTTTQSNVWVEGKWMTGLFDPLIGQLGQGLFGLLLGGAVFLGFYFAGDGDFASPTVVLMLFAGLLFPLLPGGLQGIAWVVVFIGLTSGIMAVLQKHVI